MAGLVMAAVLAAGLGAPQFDLAAGFEWSQGDYGYGETTTALLTSVAAELDLGAWGLGVSGAYARIDGPADAALLDPSAMRRHGGVVRTPAEGKRDGVTDLAISIDFHPPPAEAAWYGVTVGASLPIGDEGEGLGTGSSDVFVLGQAGYDGAPFSLALSLGYRITGEPGWRDPFSLAASVSRQFGRSGVVGAGFDYSQPLADGFDPQASISVFAGRSLGPRVQLDLRVWKGLNRASGDFGGGLTLRRALGAAGR